MLTKIHIRNLQKWKQCQDLHLNKREKLLRALKLAISWDPKFNDSVKIKKIDSCAPVNSDHQNRQSHMLTEVKRIYIQVENYTHFKLDLLKVN